jgi:serine/threonine-protein kinase
MSQPNITVLGRYKILELLGRGAMGVVYKAIDPAIDRVVAIKTINLTLSAEEVAEYEARFTQEAKAAGRLNHPNIVSIYDVGKTDSFAWMALEFIDGRELKMLMRGDKPLPLLDAIDVITQVADGLAFAHARDVIHRDIKPSNIMVMQDEDRWIAKITDFGIARTPTSAVKTMTGVVLGSPRYMSPEQVTGKAIGPTSDIFSLGVVLFEALTGAPPFDSPSINSIMYQTVHEPAAVPSSINSRVPQELDAIVARALAKAPGDRFASMRDFSKALREVRKLIENGTATPASTEKVVAPAQSDALSRLLASPITEAPETPSRQELSDGTRLAPIITDEEREANAATARQLARDFDSRSATKRLAVLTEQMEEVAPMLELELPLTTAPAASTVIPPNAAAVVARPGIDLADPTLAITRAPTVPLLPAMLLGGLAFVNIALLVALLI